VYVTSIPHDATVDEIHSVFSKYGVIAEEMDTAAPRIKIYQDEKGNPKGDVLVVYFRPESVSLAITMLDDSDFRMGHEGPSGKMRVKEADYSYKKQQEAPAQQNIKDKKKIIKRAKKLNDKLADWSSDEDVSQSRVTSGRWDKVVVLKHMFTLEELEVRFYSLISVGLRTPTKLSQTFRRTRQPFLISWMTFKRNAPSSAW